MFRQWITVETVRVSVTLRVSDASLGQVRGSKARQEAGDKSSHRLPAQEGARQEEARADGRREEDE